MVLAFFLKFNTFVLPATPQTHTELWYKRCNTLSFVLKTAMRNLAVLKFERNDWKVECDSNDF